MTNTSTDSRELTGASQTNRHDRHRGDRTIDDPDVHSATREEYDDSAAIVATLSEQETRSPLDESNCCDAGDHGFRTYKTDLPVIRSEDIEPGLLIYRPTTSPLTVYEILSEPYTNERGFTEVDVRAHSRSHAGDDPDIRSREQSLFTSSVVDEMTFLQPATVQQTLTGAGN